MTDTQIAVIGLVKAAVTTEKVELPENSDFGEVIKIAKKHGITPLIYYGGVACGLDQNLPSMKELFTCTCKYLLISQQQLYSVDEICRAFDNEKIDYLPLKGILLKKLYPRPEMRSMSDADILIKPEQYTKIKSIMSSLGYNETTQSDHEYVWQKGNIHIELHKRLIPSYNKDYYAYFGDGWLLAKQNIGTRYSMTKEDNMIYLFTHFAKHYRDAGIGIKHITDLWVFRKKHPDLNEEYIKNELSALQLYDFYINVIKTLACWFEGRSSDYKTELITGVIFSSGVYGTHEAHLLSEGLKLSKSKSNAKLKKYMKLIFLPFKDMVEKYRFLKQAPFLLPVMWFYRILVAIVFKQQTIKTQKDNISVMSNDRIDSYKQSLNAVGLDFNFKE